MVEVDTADCLKSLEEYQKKLEATLKGRTIELVQRWVQEVNKITPVGDHIKFAELYRARANTTGWKPEAGLLKGNWQMSLDQNLNQGFIQRYSPTGAGLINDSYKVQASFKLGDVITLSNSTPYLAQIEDGYSKQAPQGVGKPTLNAILDLYKTPFGDMLKGS